MEKISQNVYRTTTPYKDIFTSLYNEKRLDLIKPFSFMGWEFYLHAPVS